MPDGPRWYAIALYRADPLPEVRTKELVTSAELDPWIDAGPQLAQLIDVRLTPIKLTGNGDAARAREFPSSERSGGDG